MVEQLYRKVTETSEATQTVEAIEVTEASMRQLAMTYSIALDTVPTNHVSRNYHVEVCLLSSLFLFIYFASTF